MEEREIIEIESDFLEAWEDYFGQDMYYVKLKETSSSSIYKESKLKVYDEENKVLFHGTFKENPTEEELGMGGARVIPTGMITFVTKELVDQQVTSFSTNDVIDIVFLDGTTQRFNIIAKQGKVQFGMHKVFTKFGVREYGK